MNVADDYILGTIAPYKKALLKPPHSKRFAISEADGNFAKRLDCGAFTASLGSNDAAAGLRHSRAPKE